ncbi:MAG: hypothetical protein P0116_12710 [Candidatus Nitrosocosmicus sp.]|nr:hypothetical protein [Candidatus Nitrosocosmicus sp.]
MGRETNTGSVRFIIRELEDAAHRDVTLAEQQPYKAILTKDLSYLEAVVNQQQPDAVIALNKRWFYMAWHYS